MLCLYVAKVSPPQLAGEAHRYGEQVENAAESRDHDWQVVQSAFGRCIL